MNQFLKLITRYDGLCQKWVLSDERGSPCDVKLFPAGPAGLVLAILDEEAVIQKHACPIPIKKSR